MRVKYAGSNLYGQCKGESNLIIDKFITLPEHVDDVAFTLFQTFFRIGNEVFMSSKNEWLKLDFPSDFTIEQMSGCESRILFLGSKGQVFKYTCDDTNKAVELPNFLTVENSSDDAIKQVACGQCLSVALSKEGKLFNIPNLLSFDAKDVVDIKTGREHCLVLDKDGNVFSFGQGSRGQLGHGTLDDEQEPKKIEALEGIRIKQIAAGGWHSCALSVDGDLYSWGWNSNGQMGLEALNVMATPTLVDIKLDGDDLIDVKMVACGSKHTIALLVDGQLCGFGWNKYGQLGTVASEIEITTPSLIENIDTTAEILDLKCGPWSSALLHV